jgi:NADP-dependent 3-hydroxy acid dehydrogenase YdfG
MRWTGASERTAKHWLSGLHGPSGAHLIVLARHSDHVMQTIIRLAGREGTTAESADLEIRQKLSELLELLESRFVSVRVITESAGYDGGSP